MSSASLDRVYTYHPPFGTQQDRYVALRAAGKALAVLITELTPPSREQSIALTDVQRAIQMANSAIAINEQAPAVPVATEPYSDSKFAGYQQCDGPTNKESV